jgi:hypothetical protein
MEALTRMEGIISGWPRGTLSTYDNAEPAERIPQGREYSAFSAVIP